MKPAGDKIHVLYLPRWYPHRYDPMPGLFIERHARSVAAWCKVSVLYVHADDRPMEKAYDMDISRDEELLQVKVYFRTSRSRVKFVRQAINAFKFLAAHGRGYSIIKNEYGKADLIHVNVLTRLGIVAMFHKFFRGVPYVITEHWTRYLPSMDNFRGSWRKWSTRLVVRHAAAVLPVTDNLRKAMESHGLRNNRYVIIPNVVDMKMFMPMKERVTGPQKRFIHVSCFEDRQKNISGLLRVLKRLKDHRQDWQCLMIGDGIHFERLRAYSGELGLDERNVVFLGLKENEELAGYMRDADFQVMFSRFENLPVVILESYASGVPVLSTRVGGIHEHLHPGLGILIPSEDEDALFEKLNEMLDHPEHFVKEDIRKYAEDHFSKEVIGRRLYEVYREVLK
jgi:glycosyltransferase involved in cell wall biosynthesis